MRCDAKSIGPWLCLLICLFLGLPDLPANAGEPGAEAGEEPKLVIVVRPEAEQPAADAEPRFDTLTTRPRATPPKWRGARIDLSLRDADLVEVLRSFAKIGRFNLVLDPSVKGTVTVELRDVPWDAALVVILRTHGLAAEVDGRIVSVQPLAPRR